MSPLPKHVLQALREMFGPKISIAAHIIGAAATPLTDIEKAAIARAIPARQAEFQAGRHAAKSALQKAGANYASIPMGTDRAPIWPTDFTGAISHCEGLAIAAAAPLITAKALGLDVETAHPLDPDLWGTILTEQEHLWLQSCRHKDQGKYAKAMFSIKECVYKAQYSVSRRLLDFNAFTTTFCISSGNFEAVFQRDVAPFMRGEVIQGKLAFIDDVILTTTVL